MKREIPSCPSYYATEDGEIFSYKKLWNWKSYHWHKMKPKLNEKGYATLSIWVDGKLTKKKVHRMVWEAFNGKIPDGLEINHLNRIRDDNRLANLEVVTH